MLLIIIVIICTLTAINVDSFVPLSPCPDIFKYHQINITGEWIALVYIPSPQAVISIKLNIALYLKAALPTKYVGILELTEPREVVLRRLTESVWKPISYVIKFPLESPLPTVKNISVNNNILCMGPPVVGPVITTIHLEHTLFPRRPIVINNNVRKVLMDGSENVDKLTGAGSGYRVLIGRNKECGQTTLINPLIVGGNSLHGGEWPWLVAIFITQALGLQFHCSATLISHQFIITAGHCIDHEETGKLSPDSVLIYLGKYNLKNWTEPNSLLRQALEIYIHPNYNRHNFSSDLALVKFEPIKFTVNIKPACLWSGSSKLDPYIGNMGTVVGWGRGDSENKVKNEPHHVRLKIVSQEECLRSRADFTYLTSDNTLCAGNRNGSGPCNGDSGAGLLILNETTYQWELRGIVSLSLLNSTTRLCNLNEYTVFTDAAKFHNWVMSYFTET